MGVARTLATFDGAPVMMIMSRRFALAAALALVAMATPLQAEPNAQTQALHASCVAAANPGIDCACLRDQAASLSPAQAALVLSMARGEEEAAIAQAMQMPAAELDGLSMFFQQTESVCGQ